MTAHTPPPTMRVARSSRALRWARPAVPAFLVGALACGGAGGEIKKSQHATVTQRVGRTEISLVYNRPVARGRRLFGGIVPWGQPWNPGADDATTITVSRDVRVNGAPLPAGTYSAWAIPDSTRWTVIFSRAADVFHTPYPEGKDALRVIAVPRAGPHMETLGFYFPAVEGARAELVLHWGETVVPLALVAQ